MCGIHGVFALQESFTPSAEDLGRMARVTVHRGPDDEGRYVAPGIAMGMRRLSIIDLAGGHQPIANEDESVWVVCNGEIYNFRELREKLHARGHTFRTHSDTEVLVHLYEEYGDDFVKHLSGMFGFALWDVNRRRLLIGRDRLGIKPLYYYRDASRLVFASELKSIIEIPGVRRKIDPTGLEQYLALGYTPTPYSILAGIRKLPPASMMVCHNGHVDVRRYWDVRTTAQDGLSEQEWSARVLDQLEQAVVSQMVSDVPLGAFLSGGIDSSSVVALMAKHSDQPVRTYSIGFDTGKAGEYYNELPYARQVAKLFGTDHKEILVKPDVVTLLPKLLWHMDEPIADAAFITTYLVAEFARRDVTVILSGVGGDELFGGYRRYLGEYYSQYYNLLPKWFRTGVLAPAAARLPSDRHSALLNLSRYARSFILSNELPFEERYRSYVQVFSANQRAELLVQTPEETFDALGQAFGSAGQGDAMQRLFRVDLMTQLPDDLLMLTDKMTMATSIECRVPLLDDRLLDLAATMPSHLKIRGRTLKHILKKALRGLLPDEILYRKKRGFGAPMGAWLKQELAPLMKSVLSQDSVKRRGWFQWDSIAQTIAMHESNREDHTDHLLSLMNLELWCRMYLDGQSPADLSEQIRSELTT
jgi:asparagine synthase (glutamine-hydrolysing)